MAELSSRDADPSADRWRDKLELRLDNRQVFFLFFGSAVVACMLFVLGVMVGKRIESRGQAEAPQVSDPLAALDRARQPPAGVAAPDRELAFPSTLIGAPKAVTAKPPAAPKPVAVKAPAPPKAPAPVLAPPKPAAPVVALKPAAPVVAVRPPAAVVPVRPAAPIAAARTVLLAPAPKPVVATPTAKGKFTLHLSTFGTAETANAFAEKYPGAFVVAGDVPGKGLAYRVRYGNFASFKDATAAKESFEKEHNAIALVAAR